MFYSANKTYVLNMYRRIGELYGNSSILGWIKDSRRTGTKLGLSRTIRLLTDMGLLQSVVGQFTIRLVNPLLVVEATNRYIAKMYAVLTRNPEKIREFYLKSNTNTRERLREAFKALSDKMAEESVNEVFLSTFTHHSINSIYRMLISYDIPPSKLSSFLTEDALRELSYPLYLSENRLYPVLEFMRKMGILSIRTTKDGTFKLKPGIDIIYNNIRYILYKSKVGKTSQRAGVQVPSALSEAEFVRSLLNRTIKLKFKAR